MSLDLRNINWDGLFPPESSSADSAEFAHLHRGHPVLVTGAGGSIGSALARAIYESSPRALVLLDASEQNLYNIHRELNASERPVCLVPVLGSVADPNCLRDVFERYAPRVVYHAAALKHVPLGEMNPFAVALNNIFGTSVLANFARTCGAERFVMISTDKSVNPRSIMGASKRLAEMVVQSLARASTRMTSIRLGNVLGSEGSVVPLFLEQIARGGPVTVTDPHVERYFLTMEATVQRIFGTAASCPVKPAVAVPVTDKPVKIADLARYLIAQAGIPHIEIAYTGLRQGDKLQEEFVAAGETIIRSDPYGIHWVSGSIVSGEVLAAGLTEFDAALKARDLSLLLATMTRLVPEYQPSEHLVAQASAAAAR